MAQFIAVSQNEPVGLNALRVRDLLFELEKAVNEVTRPLEKLAADDAGTYTAVAAALGLNSTDDAHDYYPCFHFEYTPRIARQEAKR